MALGPSAICSDIVRRDVKIRRRAQIVNPSRCLIQKDADPSNDTVLGVNRGTVILIFPVEKGRQRIYAKFQN